MSVFILCKIFQNGTKVAVDVAYEWNYKHPWHSQSNENGRAAGSISVVALIILSGGTFERLKKIFQTALIPFVSRTTFYKV